MLRKKKGEDVYVPDVVGLLLPKRLLVRLLVRDLLRDFLVSRSWSFFSSSYFALWILHNRLAMEPSHVAQMISQEGMICRGHSPAIPDHAHPLGLGLPVELGSLLQVLLTPHPLRVAVARLGKRVYITPR